MTGRLNFTPEAERQLNALDDWITEKASADVARRFVSAVLDHIDGILAFPPAGRSRHDVRPGMRTTSFNKRTLVAYEIDESSGELVVNILGLFHNSRRACRASPGTERRSAVLFSSGGTPTGRAG